MRDQTTAISMAGRQATRLRYKDRGMDRVKMGYGAYGRQKQTGKINADSRSGSLFPALKLLHLIFCKKACIQDKAIRHRRSRNHIFKKHARYNTQQRADKTPTTNMHSHQGRVNLLSKKVWFSCLLQQNVTWRLPEWSTLWNRKSAWKVCCSTAGVCVFTRWQTEQTVNRKCKFYFVILRNVSINGLHLCLYVCFVDCCIAASLQTVK